MKKTCIDCSWEEISHLDQLVQEAFCSMYDTYAAKFKKYGILVKLQFRYHYAGKYHTDRKTEGYFLSAKISLLPEGCTYRQAAKKYRCKEFFSHKLAQVEKTEVGYRYVRFELADRPLTRFLDTYLRRAEQLHEQKKDPVLAIREEWMDVVRSVVYISRYRNEVKKSYRGFSLGWINLIVFSILIGIRGYMHQKRLSYGEVLPAWLPWLYIGLSIVVAAVFIFLIVYHKAKHK